METVRFGLFFQEIDDVIPSNPISHIYVKTYSMARYGGGQELMCLTPREYGSDVVENQIDQLIGELQFLKKEVRRKYAAYHAKQG